MTIELRTARAAIKASIATLRSLEHAELIENDWTNYDTKWLLNGIKAVRLGLEETLSLTETASDERAAE